jgi:hypothetical protein
VPVINRGNFTFPLNITVEWAAESRRGPGRLQTGVVHVLGIDTGGHSVDHRVVGQAVTVPDSLEGTELDTGGTGYPTLPLTVSGI